MFPGSREDVGLGGAVGSEGCLVNVTSALGLWGQCWGHITPWSAGTLLYSPPDGLRNHRGHGSSSFPGSLRVGMQGKWKGLGLGFSGAGAGGT